MAEYIEREAVLEFVEPDARPFLAERIKSIPAADVRPVVRGKWIQKKSWTRGVCSACSWEIAFVTGNSYNFCPNCGACMEES